MKTTNIMGLALITASGAAMAGPVYDLQPGAIYEGLSGITSAQMPELRGAIVNDYYNDFTIDALAGDSVSLYEGTMLTRVVRSNMTGNLTFNFQFTGGNANLDGQIKHIEITGFDGMQTRVEYRSEPGYGDESPILASRSDDGDIISYSFGEDFLPGESSMFFFAMLDVSEYDFETNNPQATVYLFSGESVTIDLGQPVPTPGSLALLAMGGAFASRRRR